MHPLQQKRVFLPAVLIAGLCASWMLSQGPGRGRDAFSEPATNLKVLKVDNPEDLRPIMQNFGRSLNVNCRFCHDTQDFAKDIPHKETARRMIEMVNQLNTQIFTWERAPRATCNMCHNGSVYPQFDPPSQGSAEPATRSAALQAE